MEVGEREAALVATRDFPHIVLEAPELSFQADTSIDYAMHVDALLHRPEVERDLGEHAGGGDSPGDR